MSNGNNNLASDLPQDLSDRDLELSALQWHVEHGADELLQDEPVDRTAMPELPSAQDAKESAKTPPKVQAAAQAELLGASEAKKESQKLADAAKTLEELESAIKGFDGLSVKKTATNMVFADGNPKARVMLVGEAPGADEDRQGKPFVGASGQLLDKILSCIDLNRGEEDIEKAVYISNILNWRPPGNRTPTPAEIDISLPFIQKHIELIKPKFLILCGGVSAKSLLNSTDSISKLRGRFHDVLGVQAIATYHPSYLLRTPSQKSKVWADMLDLRAEIDDKGLK